MAVMMVVAVDTDTHTNAADMNADGDTGGCRSRAQQTQRKNRYEQFLHDNSL